MIIQYKKGELTKIPGWEGGCHTPQKLPQVLLISHTLNHGPKIEHITNNHNKYNELSITATKNSNPNNNLYLLNGRNIFIYIPRPFPPFWGIADNTKTMRVLLRSSSNDEGPGQVWMALLTVTVITTKTSTNTTATSIKQLFYSLKKYRNGS